MSKNWTVYIFVLSGFLILMVLLYNVLLVAPCRFPEITGSCTMARIMQDIKQVVDELLSR